MNLRELWVDTKKELDSSNISDSDIESEVIIRKVLGLDRNNFFATLDNPVSIRKTSQIKKNLQQRISGIPLSYITKNREFFGIDFFVNEHVLIPRQESELLVEKVISFCKKQKQTKLTIADIGTGSGALAISIAKNLKNTNVIATDISNKALQIAKKNAKNIEVSRNISFLHSNLLENLKTPVNMIVANLPYLTSKEMNTLSLEVKKEPTIALFGGEDGTDLIVKLIRQAPKHLKKNGNLILEISPSQKNIILSLMKESFPKSKPKIHKDYAKIERAISIEI